MTKLVNPNDLLLMLHSQFKLSDYAKKVANWAEFANPKIANMTLNEAQKLAIRKILPTNVVGDQQGAQYKDGEVRTPEEFKDIWNLMADGGWIAMTQPVDLGGMEMPNLLATACKMYLTAANFAFMMYPGLACEVGDLLSAYDIKGISPEAKKAFIEGLYTGQYGGTMCLTEPQAGSDVGALETTAKVNDDGTYTITGSKIFITNGENDLTENILHPVLTRLEGAPAGTKGISLFFVPKLIDGKNNNVRCTRVEEKMGIHGNGTCAMSFDGSQGWLIGEENKGMSIMFSMMNRARHMVAMQGVASAYASYMYALDYAKERVQGRHISDFANHEAPAIPIINHPDVRRMLATMKAYVEGMSGLVMYVAYAEDQMMAAEDKDSADDWHGLVNFLTPLAKGFCCEKAVDICNMAMQVYGGAGYTKEYPLEQLVRDVRITPIYEGTSGIQSMDFLFRQMMSRSGRNALNLIAKIQETVEAASKVSEELAALSTSVNSITTKLLDAAMELSTHEPVDMAYNSFPFMMATGHVIIGWQLLWKASVGDESSFHTAKFFIENILPSVAGQIQSIRKVDTSAAHIEF